MRRHGAFLVAVLVSWTALDSAPAAAQSLGQWGLWGERGERWKKPKSKRELRDEREMARRGRFEPAPWWDDDVFMQRRTRKPPPSVLTGGPRPAITPREPETVAFDGADPAGTIIIDTEARRLYFTLGDGEAFAYPISVGRDGFTWTGTEKISRIADWPDWHPPKEMRQRDPRLPEKMLGGTRNPLGAVAMYLGNTLYRIHGTNDKKTIGQAASSGCFRMLNEHAVHLASIAGVGTVVKVLPHLPPPDVASRTDPSPGLADDGSEVDGLDRKNPDSEEWTEAPPDLDDDEPPPSRIDIRYRPNG